MDFRADRFKTSLQFINVAYKCMYAALDACKAADYVIFVLSSSVEVEEWGDNLLRILQAQGLPDVVTIVSSDSSLDTKSRPSILKSLLSFIQYFIPTQSKIFDLHASSDRLNAVRALSEGKPGEVRWRDGRAWILGEKVEWSDGILSVTGVVRGAYLSANRLIHIPNHGDFQIFKVGLCTNFGQPFNQYYFARFYLLHYRNYQSRAPPSVWRSNQLY
jgi:pre-rRNA-processing protein TSR1